MRHRLFPVPGLIRAQRSANCLHCELFPTAPGVESKLKSDWPLAMHVNLGRRGDHAIRASIDLARHWDSGPRKAREIATSMDVPPESVKQVLANLVAHGILTSTAGPSGGYRLAQSPAAVTLLNIIEAVEGPFVLDQCVLRGGPCDWTEACPIHDTWSDAQRLFADSLAATNLADLAHIDHNIESGTHTWTESIHLNPTRRRGTRT